MSYQVLARKYRPQNFDEVVGQEHVTTTLKNAILSGRLHHAYLLTGVRGTGKTSLARVLAKALNCEKGPTDQPCGHCSRCQEISSGHFLDVIEIDGASNTSVESIRQLREQIKYMPASSKYKLYIIDEVHMLSTSAFNALLKTLEEPPQHVLFIFATTEVHKIPVTILSRCQRFDLRRLSQIQLRERLQFICKNEAITYEAPCLDLLARLASGSMRDAQSLLDRAIACYPEGLKLSLLLDLLGLSEDSFIEELSRDCFKGNMQAALKKVQEVYDRGLDLRQLALQWLDYLHDLSLFKAAGPKLVSDSLTPDRQVVMQELANLVELDDLQVAFQTLYRAVEEIDRSDQAKILFDLLIVRLIHGAPYQSLGHMIANEASDDTPSQVQHESLPIETPQASLHPHPSRLSTDIINHALKRYPRMKAQVKAALDNAIETGWQDATYVISFEEGSSSQDLLRNKCFDLAKALSEEMGRDVKVEIRSVGVLRQKALAESPEKALIEEDPVVSQAVKILNASIEEVRIHGHE